MINGEWNLNLIFKFDFGVERETKIIWCVIIWDIEWLMLTIGDLQKLKCQVMRNINDNSVHSHWFLAKMQIAFYKFN